jgi:hypothetical protein
MSKSKAEIRTRFSAVVAANAASATNTMLALQNKAQSKQHVVDKNGWSGDVFDIAGLGKPWSRAEHGDDVVSAIKDIKDPGVIGDLIASVLQGDWLSAQERAFRERHKSKIRVAAHAAARRRGHGHKAGLFEKGTVNYVKSIVKLSKDIREA